MEDKDFKITDHLVKLPEDGKTTEERAAENGWTLPEGNVYTIKKCHCDIIDPFVPSKRELETPWYRRFENKKRKKK